jgi:hypothetical protein
MTIPPTFFLNRHYHINNFFKTSSFFTAELGNQPRPLGVGYHWWSSSSPCTIPSSPEHVGGNKMENNVGAEFSNLRCDRRLLNNGLTWNVTLLLIT